MIQTIVHVRRSGHNVENDVTSAMSAPAWLPWHVTSCKVRRIGSVSDAVKFSGAHSSSSPLLSIDGDMGDIGDMGDMASARAGQEAS